MVGEVAAFADTDHRVFSVGGFEVGVFRIGETFVAYENRCPHDGGPVCQGKIINRVEEIISGDRTSRGLRFSNRRNLICPWHGFEFDLETGRHSAHGSYRLRPVDVKVREAKIYVTVPARG